MNLTKKLFILIVIFSLIFYFALSLNNNNLTKATVTNIYDGDTIQVKILNSYYTVRLIGIDTPEIKGKYNSKNEYFGIKSKKYLESILPLYSNIYLEKDTENKDKYGRLLRYVYKDDKKTMINQLLLKNGYARTLFIKPNTKYQKIFKSIEKQSKEEKKGLWQKK